jgi:hypothetical protein
MWNGRSARPFSARQPRRNSTSSRTSLTFGGPDRLSLRHSKLEAKRRLAAGEFTTLHDAQLAVARAHGMSSWAALKEHIAAAEAEQGHAFAQVRWVLGRYGEAAAPGWTAPDRDELGEHVTEHFLTLVGPETAAAILRSVAPKLREDLVVIDAGPFICARGSRICW